MFQKTLSLSECCVKMEGETGRFAGYASTFGRKDNHGDTILKGAYAATLREFGHPKMYVQHDHKGLPIGKWVGIKEDDHGLMVEGEFTPGMARADEVRAALKHGTIDGLSIGFLLKKSDYDEKADGRVIRSVSKLVEISIVSHPADPAARIDMASVKSDDIEQLRSIRDYETFLRDAGGFSKGVAASLVIRAKTLFSQGDPDGEELDAKEKRDFDATIDRLVRIRTHADKLVNR